MIQDNPFPGMNPWLESHWGDLHTSLTTHARDHLQPQLPAGLRARIEEYVEVESDEPLEGPRRRFAPDVRAIERPDATAESENVATSVATMAEPQLVLDDTAEPRPPLIGPDADWADQLLRAKGLR